MTIAPLPRSRHSGSSSGAMGAGRQAKLATTDSPARFTAVSCIIGAVQPAASMAANTSHRATRNGGPPADPSVRGPYLPSARIFMALPRKETVVRSHRKGMPEYSWSRLRTTTKSASGVFSSAL